MLAGIVLECRSLLPVITVFIVHNYQDLGFLGCDAVVVSLCCVMVGRNIQEETFHRPLRPLKMNELCPLATLGNTNPGTQHDLQRDLNSHHLRS